MTVVPLKGSPTNARAGGRPAGPCEAPSSSEDEVTGPSTDVRRAVSNHVREPGGPATARPDGKAGLLRPWRHMSLATMTSSRSVSF